METEFEDFEYSIQDSTLDDIKNDIMAIDNSVQNQIVSVRSNSSVSELGVKEIYDTYAKKYGITIGYTSFRDFLNNVHKTTKLQADMLEAVNAQIALTISQRTSTKIMLTLAQLIDKTCELAMKEAEFADGLTAELVGMIDKLMVWQSQLEELNNSYSEKISDPQRRLTQLIEKDKANKEEKLDLGNISLLNDIINHIKNSN